MPKTFQKLVRFSKKLTTSNGHGGRIYSVAENSSNGRAINVPSGHFPIYVGDEHRKYVVPVKRLSSPRLQTLLNQFKEEIIDSKEPITLPCSPMLFEHVLGLDKA